jgi:protein SCO1
MVRRAGWLVGIVAAAAVLAGCSGEGGAASRPALEGITRPEPLQVGSVVVPEVDADGNETDFAFRADDGELLFVYFGYTLCPDLCPTTFADFKGALALLDPDDAARLSAAFVTVDPDRDTPEIMVGYLGYFVDRGHAIRITDPERLRATETAFGASSTIRTTPEGVVEVSHTSISYIVDSTGSVVVEWPFGVKSAAMAADLRILLDHVKETP